MKTQTNLSRNQKIHAAILEFFKANRKINVKHFNSFSLIEYVCKSIGTKYIYPDTILRELRRLRQENKLNYLIDGAKKKMTYKVLKVNKINN